jgi:hypothetical protein
MWFHLITGFSQSSDRFCNNQEGIIGQGVLQGSSSAGLLFILNSDISLTTYNLLGKGAAFIHPINKMLISDKTVQYVGNTSQFLNPLGAGLTSSYETKNIGNNLLPIASQNSQQWADLLWTSGGNLNLNKCYYYAFSFTINYNKNKITMKDLPMDKPILIRNPANNMHTPLEYVPPSICHRTLGVSLSPDGNGNAQLKHCLHRAKELQEKLSNCRMSPRAKYLSIMMVIEPALIYPLLYTS